MTYGELDSLVATLSRNIDQRIKDFGFRYYSTTRDHDLEETIGTYDERAYSGVLDRAQGYMGEFMRGLVEWFEEVDEPAEDPREMHHYVTTRVEPDDVHVRRSNENSDFRRRKAMQRELYDRLDTLESKMFAGVTGVTTDRVSAEEHAEILLAYWTGEQHEPDERLERKFNRSEDGPSVWPDARQFKAGNEESGTVDDLGSEAARDRLRTGVSQDREAFDGSDMQLAGSHFDAKKGYIEVGEQYAATLWVADYPTDIESNFLKPLYAMDGVNGVDLDITIDATAVDKKQAQEELQDGEANTNAKAGEQSRIESRGTDEGGNVYADAGELLRNTNAQAWDISMYVTVRAGSRAALDLAESDHRDSDGWDAARMAALQEGINDVKEVLESSPIEATVIRPQRMQRELFDSCSPNKGISPRIPSYQILSMAPRIASLYKNEAFRIISGAVGVLAASVLFTDVTLHSIAPLAIILLPFMAHNVVDESYNLPKGSNWIVYGGSIFAAGTYLAVINPTPWAGGLLALVGLWFVFDGVATLRHESSQTGPEFEYVSDLDDETGAGEMMLRMQTLNVVYQALNDAPEPQTGPELATDLDLTESRVESALEYLESKGRVERVGNQYRAEPPQWGRVTPIVDFLVWLPRRIVCPFRRVAANA